VSVNRKEVLPRRLIYIVNRRTVVDQATEIAERLRDRILEGGKALDALKKALRRATALSEDEPIAISTLRGELADNQEWKEDPARPAIIVGTIDMIGSKLLFSGYGDTYRTRPHHAGLIGHDSLIIHDESHLTPAFGALLCTIAEEQKRCGEPRRIHVMELSATPSAAEDDSTISLEPEDEDDALVPQKLDAEKALFLHDVAAGQSFNAITERALRYRSAGVKVLIYVRFPETAREIVGVLEKALGEEAVQRVALLTGTIRGYERDKLVKENRVYKAFLPPPPETALAQPSEVKDALLQQTSLPCESQPQAETVYLVSTSAGEVGVDLDADHMVSDISTLDSIIQRLGRVNRRGGKDRMAVVDVIVEERKKEDGGQEGERAIERAEANTRLVLEKLPPRGGGGHDASPRALRELLRRMSDDERSRAFAPKPNVTPVTDILLDAWALTSVREKLPGRPEVAAYLHGMTTSDPPETYVAWRSEVTYLAEANAQQLLDDPLVERWFENCRIEAHERLRDRTDRVVKELQRIAKRVGGGLQCVKLSERGKAELVTLGDLLGSESSLQYHTIVLPAEAGGLTDKGILNGGVNNSPHLDVAEIHRKRTRILIESDGSQYWHKPLTGGIGGDAEVDLKRCRSPRKAAARIAKDYGKVISEFLKLREPDEGGADSADEGDETDAHAIERYLLLLVEPKKAATETPESAAYRKMLELDDHLKQAAEMADRITGALGLEDSLKDAVVAAARWHDCGKERKRWQHAIYNDHPSVFYAKSGPKGMDWRRLGGYRHEFGSMLDVAQKDDVLRLSESDLVLHLIAAHHGHARPHFHPDGWDVEKNDESWNAEAAHEAIRRYGRLQRRFGRWGLAWLESLVRCADVAASRQSAQQDTPSEEVDD
jgi:CRISPR-associated endonuclease/helicase Cas3